MIFQIYDGAEHLYSKEFESEAECLFWCNERKYDYVPVKEMQHSCDRCEQPTNKSGLCKDCMSLAQTTSG